MRIYPLNYYRYFKEIIRLKIKSPGMLAKIKSNNRFKNCHAGKRCFIIGNGPSLKEQNLSLLADEYVFTVNQVARNPQFVKMNSNYHFWADPGFFKLSSNDPGDKELITIFKKIRTKSNNPVCFLPAYAMDFAKRFNLDKELNINFYSTPMVFNDGNNKKIDFSKPTFSYQTVVQFAIAMAIYMGFSEIYLLGCDCTGIIGTIEAALGQEVTQYAYSVSENEKSRMKKMTATRGMENDLIGWGRILHLYGELYRYCKSRNITLVNCSARSIIDNVPRIKYNEIIVKGRQNVKVDE